MLPSIAMLTTRYSRVRARSLVSWSIQQSQSQRYGRTASLVFQQRWNSTINESVIPQRPIDNQQMFKYFHLEQFTTKEFEARFDRIYKTHKPTPTLEEDFCSCAGSQNNNQIDNNNTINIKYNINNNSNNNNSNSNSNNSDHEKEEIITLDHLRDFLLKRIKALEDDNHLPYGPRDDNTEQRRLQFATQEASRIFTLFQSPVTKLEFSRKLMSIASTVETAKVMPITISMLLVGSSVGIIIPVMPFIVEHLGLTPGQFGMVVSAFALTKMAGNVPAAILVERHGRKPYLVYSLSLIAFGVGGIGLATSFEHLWVCRLLTGLGVAALSTAATMSITDISNPRNRATTMAPIMSAFAAGTALGPALGGMLADQIGLHETFYAVGISYFGLTVVNHWLLQETRPQPIVFDWQQASVPTKASQPKESILQATQKAVGQWAPLLSQPKVRNVVLMNGFYWVALAGSQMTLLPLLLTDPTGLNMTATQLGQVYMGMSLVQVLGNPLLAKGVDHMGKGRAILCGCYLLSASMAMLPFTENIPQLAGVLGLWATGSTMLSTAPVAYISDHTDDTTRAQAIALLRTSGDIGFLVGAASMGALADWTGNLNVALQSSAGILFLATTWFGVRQLLQVTPSPTAARAKE